MARVFRKLADREKPRPGSVMIFGDDFASATEFEYVPQDHDEEATIFGFECSADGSSRPCPRRVPVETRYGRLVRVRRGRVCEIETAVPRRPRGRGTP